MESNINGGEDTQQKESSPQIIDSIIEQRSNEDTNKCDHFSIRAYVAEIRKRDWKICWPFCSSVECKKPNDHQEFRCWYYRNSLGSSDSSHDAADTYVFLNIYDDKDREGNVDMTSYEYIPLINLVSKGKNSSAMSKTKMRHNAFASGKKERNVAVTVHEGISESTQFLDEQNVSRDAETRNLDVGGDSNCGILDFEFGDRKLKCKRTFSNESFKGDPAYTVPETEKTCEKGTESESMESGSLDSQASCYRKLCSLESNRNDQNKDTEGFHGEQQSNKCYEKILKSKRPQKIRLLSDILGREISNSNGTMTSDNMDTRVTDTKAADDSDDLTLDTLFRIPEIVHTNIGKIIGCKNKRKRLQVKDLRPGQRRWSNSEPEVWSCQNLNKKNNSVQSISSSSESLKTSSKISQKNLCQESQLVSTDQESQETRTGSVNHQFHLPNIAPTGFNLLKYNVGGSEDCHRESISCVKEGRDKGSLMLPHNFFPMKKGYSVPCNYENNLVAPVSSVAKEIPSSESDALGDIPMEIVKLLAENRRERRLLEAERAGQNTVSLLRSANGVENSRKVHPTIAYDDNPKDSGKNTFQGQRKPSQISAKSSPKQCKPLDIEIYSEKTAEKPCACVQKKIKMSPELDVSPSKDGNEYLPKTGTSARTPHNDGLHKITGSLKRPFPDKQGKDHIFREPKGQVSGDIVSGSIKSCKKIKLQSSLSALQAMNGRVNGHISGKITVGRGYDLFSFNKGPSSASDSIALPMEPNMANGRVKQAEVKKKDTVACGSDICTVNRNPADFSIPGTGNKFMRRGKVKIQERVKPNLSHGKMEGSMKGLIVMPTCVA